VTILLMDGSSLLVGLTPTYATAGVLGPVVLVLARLLQSLSVGGEFAASTTFLVEGSSSRPGSRYAEHRTATGAAPRPVGGSISAAVNARCSRRECGRPGSASRTH
jgi:MFS family permease